MRSQGATELTQCHLFTCVMRVFCTQINCFGPGDTEKKFCGNILPAEMTFDCRKLMVTFFTDAAIKRTGFKMRFSINKPTPGWW